MSLTYFFQVLNKSVKAIEFFSGIGSFHEAVKNKNIDVIQAFDQSEAANQVYHSNFGIVPISKNLASIDANQIDEADLWWLSPPCTPFSRRGNQLDDQDKRSQAFLNLISIVGQLTPEHIFVENVVGFEESRVYQLLAKELKSNLYNLRTFNLCSTDFGVPMRRPRTFLVASRSYNPVVPGIEEHTDNRKLEEYICNSNSSRLKVPESTLSKYHDVLNIVDPYDPDTVLICFTSGYFRCNKASGSLLAFDDGINYAHPRDITQLLGFTKEFHFPEEMELKKQWKLVGNSVDVRAINYLLSTIDLC